MTSRVDRLLIEVGKTFRNAADQERAAAILAAALITIRVSRPVGVDALGAPLSVRPSDVEWNALRREVKAVVAKIGLVAAAAQFGNSPTSLHDAINRRSREPGVGRKARFLKLVTDNDGNFAVSIDRHARR